MAFPIVPRYRSGSAGNPTSLNLGELAVNTHDGSLYLGADVGVVQIGVPVAAGTELTEWTANGSASQFAPINGYNGTDPKGYLVTVQGIDQPFSVTSANGGTLVFDFTPTAGSVIRARAITQASGGGGGGIPSADVQVFDTAGTFEWTKPANAKSVNIVCVGGGQGGRAGGFISGGGGPSSIGGGNGGVGGTYSERTIAAVNVGSTEFVVVGNGGSVSDGSGDGYSGGTSSFGSHVIASGGGISFLGIIQGGNFGSGADGYSSVNGSSAVDIFSSSGGGGGAGAQYDGNGNYIYGDGGFGGNSCIGNGGAGGSSTGNKNGQNGAQPGGGGGGGAGFTSDFPDSGGTGGAGGAGIVIVTTYF